MSWADRAEDRTMRIAFSVLVGLIICAAGAAGIYYYPVAQSPAVSATPQTEQTVVNPAASQAEQKTDAAPATEQPVTSPIPPAALPPRVVKTETIAPLPDGAAGTMAQQGRITAAKLLRRHT